MDQDGERLSGREGLWQENTGAAALDPDATPASPSSRGRMLGASGGGSPPGQRSRTVCWAAHGQGRRWRCAGPGLFGWEARTTPRVWSASLPASGLDFLDVRSGWSSLRVTPPGFSPLAGLALMVLGKPSPSPRKCVCPERTCCSVHAEYVSRQPSTRRRVQSPRPDMPLRIRGR